MKAKLGISVGLLGAITYLMALFGGYLYLFVLIGYILIVEENIWLKKSAIKAIAVCLFFSVITTVVGLIPDLIYVINKFCCIFEETLSAEVLSKIIDFIQAVISFVRTIVILILGITALNQSTIKLPVVDKLIDKHFIIN